MLNMLMELELPSRSLRRSSMLDRRGHDREKLGFRNFSASMHMRM
jgi:hypothetical protein